MIFDSFLEGLATRPLVRVGAVVQAKREVDGKLVNLDVRNFFTNPENQELKDVVDQFKALAEPDRVRKLFEWVVANLTISPDPYENWSFPYETLWTKRGDCEDGAILLANLMRAAGVPYYSVMLNVAEIPGGMHVFVTYDGVRLLDWTRPQTFMQAVPPEWKLWYCWNAKHCYCKAEDVEKWKRP